jgi:beta-lactamase superfamily II metal-dependent hydrolase
MGIEIDFLPVGNESSGGDAIAFRYGNLHGARAEQVVVIVDGGYKESGEELVSHLREHFDTNVVDIVISTHPDQDHASGLTVVLEEMEVGVLWMHLPWNHSDELSELGKANFKSEKFSEKVEASLQSVKSLEEIASSKNIPIVEPFTGLATDDGVVRILGPSVAYYEELLGEMAEGQSLVSKILGTLAETVDKVAQKLLPESLYKETLTDTGETHPRNNTSAITLVHADDRTALLTGDAGAPALNGALDEMESLGIEGEFNVVQIPHHGSRRNVGPTVLDRLLGDVTETRRGAAYVSAPKENPENEHPSKKVTNAFRRRGYHVYATQGDGKLHHHDAPDRPGWATATALPFYEQVEADGDDA